jgi:hypothetical protein
MIADTITKKIGEAMKAHDEIRLSTLRLLSSFLNYEFIAKQHKLSDEEELVVVKREINKRKDAIEAYTKAKALDRAEREQKELEILKEYMPEQISDKELTKIVEEEISAQGAVTFSEMGKVIGGVMKKIGSRADGGRVSQIVKSKLS